jgi:hypothetical protein
MMMTSPDGKRRKDNGLAAESLQTLAAHDPDHLANAYFNGFTDGENSKVEFFRKKDVFWTLFLTYLA